MTFPGVLLAILIASVIGVLYHLVRGGSLQRLVLYLISAWIAFFTGHFLGSSLDWTTWRWGSLNMLPSLLVTVLALILADVLAGPRKGSRRKIRKSPRHRR
jgi:uncharacterized membrane protein